jgi:hypothetical protein
VQNEEIDKPNGQGNEQEYEHDSARTRPITARMPALIGEDASTCGSSWRVAGS